MNAFKLFLLFGICSFGLGSFAQSTTEKISVEFDLHGCDCGAPDCYTTTFSLTKADLGAENVFISVEETGCVERSSWKGEFERVFSEGGVQGYFMKGKGTLLLKMKDGMVEDAMFVEEMRVTSWKQAKACFQKSCEDEKNPSVYTLR